MDAQKVFDGSDGSITVEYYKLLASKGPIGKLAVALFRAQKCSERAKKYRRGSYRRDAYDRKTWSIGELIKVLEQHPNNVAQYGVRWGWKQDPNVIFDGGPSWVFYCDIPTGQVSFHVRDRGQGKAYEGEWDGVRGISQKRVIDFCNQIIKL